MRPCCLLSLLAAASVGLTSHAQDHDDTLRLSFESLQPNWSNVALHEDGMRGRAASFNDPRAAIDLGPWPVDSRNAFTLSVALRTTEGGFSTILMARTNDAVGLSLVMGREPGCISFEAWSWQRVRVLARRRVDDGAWHRIKVEYEPTTTIAALFIDGELAAWDRLGEGGSPNAALRLGNNIGSHQPFPGDLDEFELSRQLARPERFASLTPILSPPDMEHDLISWRAKLLPHPTSLPGNKDEWLERRAAVRRDVADAIGLTPFPERAPLEVQSSGEMLGQGVRIQRVTWNAWPGARASGWLWLPETPPTKPMPALVMPHGHWAGGAFDPLVQARAARFARAGYVVLCVDNAHVEDVAAGVSSIGVMTWNNIRGIDLLCARDDVDPARIGVTGASGGAQQTMYLMAIDDRIAAAAPVCMISSFREILSDRSAHCECNHPPRVGAIADEPTICATFAPKPALYISDTQDWTHNFPDEGWPEIQRVYELLGAKDAVKAVHLNAPHGYDRTMRDHAAQFFDRLLNPANLGATEEGYVPFPPEVMRSLGGPAPPPDREALAAEHLARRAPITELSALAPNLPWRIERAALHDLGSASEGSLWRRFTVSGADGVRIPFLARGLNDAGTGLIVVVVAEKGRAPLLLDPPAWLDACARVVIVEPRFTGDWRQFKDAWRRNGLLLGCGEAYQAAHDVAQVIESLPGDSDAAIVSLDGSGFASVLATHLSPRTSAVIVDDLGASLRTLDGEGGQPFAPEWRRFGDGDGSTLIRLIANRCRLTLGGAPPEIQSSIPNAARLNIQADPLTAEQIHTALH